MGCLIQRLYNFEFDFFRSIIAIIVVDLQINIKIIANICLRGVSQGIKDNRHHDELRKLYLDKKNKNSDLRKHSRSLYAEAVHEICQRYFYGTSGVEYEIVVTVFAENDNGSDSRSITFYVMACALVVA